MTIHTLYRKHAHTIHEDATIAEVVSSLTKHNISSIIVVDSEKKITGIVSISDIVNHIVPEEFKENAEVAEAMYKHNFFNEACEGVASKTARDIMRREFMIASPDAHVMSIAADFLKNDLYIVPIVEDSKLVGVMTRTEMISAIAKAMQLSVDK